MLLDRVALRHFHGRPEAVARALCGGVRGTDDDVAGERVVVEHELERCVELLVRHLPGDERAFRQIRGHERLAHAADRAGAKHDPDALHDRLYVDTRQFRDLAEGIADESGDAILGDRQNLRVDRIGVGNGRSP